MYLTVNNKDIHSHHHRQFRFQPIFSTSPKPAGVQQPEEDSTQYPTLSNGHRRRNSCYHLRHSGPRNNPQRSRQLRETDTHLARGPTDGAEPILFSFKRAQPHLNTLASGDVTSAYGLSRWLLQTKNAPTKRHELMGSETQDDPKFMSETLHTSRQHEYRLKSLSRALYVSAKAILKPLTVYYLYNHFKQTNCLMSTIFAQHNKLFNTHSAVLLIKSTVVMLK